MTKKVTMIPFIQVKYFSITKKVEVLDMPVNYFDKIFKRRLCEFPWNFQQGFPKLQRFEMVRTECECCGNVTHVKANYLPEYEMEVSVPGFWNN